MTGENLPTRHSSCCRTWRSSPAPSSWPWSARPPVSISPATRWMRTAPLRSRRRPRPWATFWRAFTRRMPPRTATVTGSVWSSPASVPRAASAPRAKTRAWPTSSSRTTAAAWRSSSFRLRSMPAATCSRRRRPRCSFRGASRRATNPTLSSWRIRSCRSASRDLRHCARRRAATRRPGPRHRRGTGSGCGFRIRSTRPSGASS